MKYTHILTGVVTGAPVLDDELYTFEADVDVEGEREYWEIWLHLIDIADRELVEPGAVFFFRVHEDNTSSIRFRRLPGFTDSEIERARVSAMKLVELFNQSK